MLRNLRKGLLLGTEPMKVPLGLHYPCNFRESQRRKIEVLDHCVQIATSARPVRSGKCSMSHCTKSASGIRFFAWSRFHRFISIPTSWEGCMNLVISPVPQPMSPANCVLPSFRINLFAAVDFPNGRFVLVLEGQLPSRRIRRRHNTALHCEPRRACTRPYQRYLSLS
jgi:hypothetical protein